MAFHEPYPRSGVSAERRWLLFPRIAALCRDAATPGFMAPIHVRILEVLAAHEPSIGARPVPGRSGSDSLLVPEPSPSRRLHSDPLRAGTSRAPDAGGFKGARRDKSSGRSLLGERER